MGIKSRTIGATVGVAATVVEVISAIWGSSGKMLAWVNKLFTSKKTFYVWKLGSAEQPVGPKDVEIFSEQLRQISEEGSNTLVTAYPVSLHEIRVDVEVPFRLTVISKPEEAPEEHPKAGFRHSQQRPERPADPAHPYCEAR